jgi:hypothetical protein
MIAKEMPLSLSFMLQREEMPLGLKAMQRYSYF